VSGDAALTDSTGTDQAQQNANPYLFSTKRFNAPTGLYDFGMRFYSAGLGRFINRDPIREAGGLNVYAFTGNDPINSGDAWGLDDGNPEIEAKIAKGEELTPAESMEESQISPTIGLSLPESGGPIGEPSGGGGGGESLVSIIEGAGNSILQEAQGLLEPADESGAAEAAPQGDPCDTPTRPYNRARDYPNSPSAANRRAGITDHQPPLVQRYYEGDPAANEPPGHQMTPEQRAESAADPARLQIPEEDYHSQGGKMRQYSMGMRNTYFGY